MLQSIHDKAKGILGIVIVILLGAVFALWGIGDYLGGATERFAAQVDGVDISQSEFEQGVARQKLRLEQIYQGQLPDSPAFQQSMKEQVLEQLITQRVMQKMVEDQGYRVADEVLASKIKAMEAFHEDGAFTRDTYHAIVQSQGMTVKEFENLYRNDLAVQQIQDAVTRSSIVGDGELAILNQIQQQSREINYLMFADNSYIADIKPSDEEVQQYFEDNQAKYIHPETAVVSYIELKASDLEKDIPVNDEEIQQLYDDYVASQSGKEQRKASHILVNVPASADEETQQSKKQQAEKVLQRLSSGESFADVAKDVSEDPGSAAKGGDLGWVNKGMMVPEFEAALYALKKGETSPLVKSSFGYHVIQLNDVKSQEVTSFEQKKDELVAQYKEQLIEDEFYEKSELMATKAYENDQSLVEVSDALGLEVKTSAAFSRNQGTGIATNDKVRRAAFDVAVLSEGRNSDIIEMGANHALVLRMDVRTESKPKTLDEVKLQVTTALKAQKARQKSQEEALAALVKLEVGASIESDDIKGQSKLTKVGFVKRDSQTANREILREAFTMQKPQDKPVYKVMELSTGTALIQLTAVESSDKASDEQLQILARQFQNDQANKDLTAVLAYLKSQSDIVRSEDL